VLNFSRVSQLAVVDVLATAAALARRDSAQVLARWRQAIGASKKF
jgi:DNA-binding MurR/RpiR family transcriptional regulator